jgi:hypothetical protein
LPALSFPMLVQAEFMIRVTVPDCWSISDVFTFNKLVLCYSGLAEKSSDWCSFRNYTFKRYLKYWSSFRFLHHVVDFVCLNVSEEHAV